MLHMHGHVKVIYMHLNFLQRKKKARLHHHLGRDLEALSVDNGGARLVVLLLGDPHLLECRQGGQDGATNPRKGAR